MQHLLDLQANQIERILWNNGVQGRVLGGDVLPRVTAFHLSVASDQGDVLAKLQRLSGTLALHLGVRGEIRVNRRGGWITVEVPHGRFRPVSLLALLRQLPYGRIPPQTITLGLDDTGRPLLLRLPSPEVSHVLIAGTTGSGKTSLMVAMAVSLSLTNRPERTRLILIDPKGSAFAELAALPHLLTGIVAGVDDGATNVLAVLERLIREMEVRDRDGVTGPRIFVFIDEIADLAMIGGKPFEATLTRLTQRGRGAGIHVVAGTQKPLSAVIGPLVKGNFPTRIVGRVVSPEDAKVAAGVGGTGAEALAGCGDFLLLAGGLTTRFQAAFIRPADVPAAVERASAAPSPTGRQWVIREEDEPESVAGRLRKLIPFPFGGRGGHNREDPPEAIADARAGMGAWELRRKYGRGGSWAERMVKEYGPVGSGAAK